jgi:tetratricopeptide (TPR) repeat protein
MSPVREGDEETLVADGPPARVEDATGSGGLAAAGGPAAPKVAVSGEIGDATARTVAVGRDALVESTARTVAVGRDALVVGAAQKVEREAVLQGLRRGLLPVSDATMAGDGETMAAGFEGVTIASGGAPPPPVEGDPDAIERGTVIDRYVTLTRLGAGGMGVVYAAYDPELDRKVALKLLRARTGEGTAASVGKARLVREAQALARLSHPHVVAIHDVGTFGDRVWLAMEYVDGKTFGAWLKGQAPRWPEVLQAMRAVGEGLAAAHEVDLVHRDLKPDNIMIGRDGRVRVMDFGLARAAGERDGPGGAALRRPALQDVTQAGAVMGTPAYMSPEQWRGDQADARADQFSFCVTLWEAVYGERPFVGDTLVALAQAITGGALRTPARRKDAPAWLRRALQRGMQVDPARRFPSMRALLAAFAAGQARGKRIRVGAALGLLAAGAIAAPLWQQRELARREAACVAAGESIAEVVAVWNDAARERLTAALRSVGERGAVTAEKTVPWINRWAASWFAARVEGCRAATVEGTVSAEVAAETRACLAERREELAGLLEVLVEDPKVAVQRAASAAASLSPVAACADPAALARRPAPPDDPAALLRLGALRRELLRVQGMLASGRYEDGLARAEALRGAAIALGQAPLVAEAELLIGMSATKLQKGELAVTSLARAFTACGALGLDELAARAAIELLFFVGSVQARHEVAQAWAQAAELFVTRLGKGADLLGASYLNALASLYKSRGELAEAVRAFERGLALREAAQGPDHPDLAVMLNNLGNTLTLLGRDEAAQARFERGLALAERSLGEGHLLTMVLLDNLSALLLSRGALDEAQALTERALRLRQATFKSGHPQLGGSYNSLGMILQQRGDLTAARGMFERALAIHERSFGPEHPLVADAYGNLSLVARQRGSLVEAQALEEKALGIRERALGPDHLDVAWSLESLASVRLQRGELAQAQTFARRSVAIRERVPDSRELASSLTTLGTIELGLGDPAAARPLLVRALAIRERTMEPDNFLIADTLCGLADVELQAGALERALELATRARDIRVKSRPPDDPDLARPLMILGQVELERARPREALALLERALALRAGPGVAPINLAETRFAVAQALMAAGGDPGRAKALATEAAPVLRTFAGGELPVRAELEAWLRARGWR